MKQLLLSATVLFFSTFLFAQTNEFDISDFKKAGTARVVGERCFRLTRAIEWQGGAIWYRTPINLHHPFEIEMDINFGCDDHGADGIVFIFHPHLRAGFKGEGMGFGGLNPALGVEMDTYENFHLGDEGFDHIAILKNGKVSHEHGLTKPVAALPSKKNIEDCNAHRVKIAWTPSTKNLKVFFDGHLRVDLNNNIIENIFKGNPNVYWGFSAATGGSSNEHKVCLEKLNFAKVALFSKKIEQQLLLGETYSLKDVEFTSGSATLDLKAKIELEKLANLLIANKGFHVNISGHTDDAGDARRNKTLSQKRADAVLRYLQDRGIEKKRLTSSGYGERFPKTSNQTAAGRKKNRRVDVYLSKIRA